MDFFTELNDHSETITGLDALQWGHPDLVPDLANARQERGISQIGTTTGGWGCPDLTGMKADIIYHPSFVMVSELPFTCQKHE